MAHMNQEKKAAIAAELKKVVPQGWKYSLRVLNHSTIAMTISAAPVDLEAYEEAKLGYSTAKYPRVNGQLNDNQQKQMIEISKIFDAIHKALNLNNHDNSDHMTDYFDVGHYADLRIGCREKPFQLTK